MHNNITENTLVVASKNQVFVDVEKETVLLNIDTGVYFGLNPVGARIWELIQQPMPVFKIRDKILAEYDVEFERCQNDVVNLLIKLEDAGLVNVIDQENL